MESIMDHIQKMIGKAKDKHIFFMEDFRDLGSNEAVKTAIHRAVKRGLLRRLGKGVYVKPGYNELLEKEVLPPLAEVAQAIAKRDRSRIIPSGSYAQYILGMSTQVPTKLVYLTDGTPRKLKLEMGEVTFKKTSPKNLSYQSERVSLVVQALKSIGENQVDEKTKVKIIDLLSEVDYQVLKHDIQLAPQWIAEIIAKAL